MFGIIERSRLSMYETTERQARSDAVGSSSLYSLALIAGVAGLADCVEYAAKSQCALQAQNTLHETIQSIPSQYLSDVDAVLLHSIKSPTSGNDPHYQMFTLLNGLIFVRIIDELEHVTAAVLHFRRAPALEHGPVLIGQTGFIRDAVDDDGEPFGELVIGKSNFHYFFTVS